MAGIAAGTTALPHNAILLFGACSALGSWSGDGTPTGSVPRSPGCVIWPCPRRRRVPRQRSQRLFPRGGSELVVTHTGIHKWRSPKGQLPKLDVRPSPWWTTQDQEGGLAVVLTYPSSELCGFGLPQVGLRVADREGGGLEILRTCLNMANDIGAVLLSQPG